MRHTAYFRFHDEAQAIALLPQFRVTGEDSDTWDAARIDADIDIIDSEGERVPGYFLNVLLPKRNESLEQIDGWVGTLATDTKELIAGDRPRTPQRVFA